MNKEFVQQYATLERTHWWFLVRQKIITAFIKKHLSKQHDQQLQILNIGAAAGASSRFLSVFGNVVSVENESLFIEYLRANNFSVTAASITQLPFAGSSFDLVCAFDVIEHVSDDKAALSEMSRVCKPGGNICITVPAFQSLWSNHDVVNGHHRRYSRKGLIALFSTIKKLSVVDARYFNSLLFLPIWFTRKISGFFNRKKTKPQSDFSYFKNATILNSMLRFIFRLEIPLSVLLRFPFGVSLISFLKKADE